MMGATGLQQTWAEYMAPSKDDLAERTKNNIQTVVEAADKTLEELLREADRIYANPNATRDEMKQIGVRLADANKAALLASQGLQNFGAGQEQELTAAQAVLGATPENEAAWHRGDSFAQQAAEYYKTAQTNINQSANALAKEPFLNRALTAMWPSQTIEQGRAKFWGALAEIQLDLTVMAERVTSFPRRVRDRLIDGVAATAQTIQEVADGFAGLANAEYQNIRASILDLRDETVAKAQKAFVFGQDVVDVVAAGAEVIGQRAQQADRWTEKNIAAPVVDFVQDKIGMIRDWGSSFKEVGVSAIQDFQEAINRKRQERQQIKTDVAVRPTEKMGGPG